MQLPMALLSHEKSKLKKQMIGICQLLIEQKYSMNMPMHSSNLTKPYKKISNLTKLYKNLSFDSPKFGKTLEKHLLKLLSNISMLKHSIQLSILLKISLHNSPKFVEVFIDSSVFHIQVQLSSLYTIISLNTWLNIS